METGTKEMMMKAKSGMPILLLNLLLMILAAGGIIYGGMHIDDTLGVVLLVLGIIYWSLPCWIIFSGLKVVRPNEALVFTLFGKYTGTLKGEGYYFVNPFSVAVPVPGKNQEVVAISNEDPKGKNGGKTVIPNKRLSLKTMALSNDKQKINDALGNPIIISIVVIWKVKDTAKALFDVDDFADYLSIQSDSALRNIVRLYPYDDTTEDGNEKSLRGSSQEVSNKIAEAIQEKVEVAGLEIIEAKITHLAYAPEIAAAMLQRQQASAIVDARQLIVEGAVGMVEMALSKLSEQEIVELDDERKAAMVSNLMVVLCGNKDAQPIVNSGSIY